MRTALLALTLALAAGGAATVSAQSAYGGRAANAATGYGAWSATPEQIVRGGVDRLTGFVLGVPQVTPETLGGFLEVEIAPLFDFHYMAQWAAGNYWRRLDAEQRQRLGVMLGRMFLDALARNLGSYVEPLPRIEIAPGRRTSPTEARVTARVIGERGPGTRLEFRFYWSTTGWRIFDVSANGASAVAYYRTYFRELLRRKGPAALDP